MGKIGTIEANLVFFLVVLVLIGSAEGMAKLYFRHGCVSSAKTLNLLAVAHNYKSQGKGVLLVKPAMDTRFGASNITSRAGLQQEADIMVDENTDLLTDISVEQREDMYCILVDEAQFLSPKHIDQLRTITLLWKVPVIAFGLRTDFRANLFPGSRRLLEVADTIEEVKTTCYLCNKKAVFNLKHVNGVADCTGPAVQLGAEEKYFPTCFGCYRSSLMLAKQMPVDSSWLTTEGLEESATLPVLKCSPRKTAEIRDSSDDDENKDPNDGIDKIKSMRGGFSHDDDAGLNAAKQLSLDSPEPTVFAQVSP